jgi:hypothetical protein
MNETGEFKGDDAKEALESIKSMERAGYKRAVPRRWFGAGIAIFVASMFALYALDDPYPYQVFPILGIGLLIATTRERVGAYARDIPDSKAGKWALVVFVAVLIAIFFGMVFVRRVYDAEWLPIIVGLIVGLVVFGASESERRSYIAKANEGQTE